jgi:hypothetical protein
VCNKDPNRVFFIFWGARLLAGVPSEQLGFIPDTARSSARVAQWHANRDHRPFSPNF